MNKDDEIEISGNSEATIAAEECPSFQGKSNTIIPNKKRTSSSKLKRRCAFSQQWLNDPKYAVFLRECRVHIYFTHCSICKSNFSISNGGSYLINRHIKQANPKRLAETQAKDIFEV